MEIFISLSSNEIVVSDSNVQSKISGIKKKRRRAQIKMAEKANKENARILKENNIRGHHRMDNFGIDK